MSRRSGRALPLALLGVFASGCGEPLLLAPEPGLRDAARPGLVAVPGGLVDAAGGNLAISRLDLSLDTLVGREEIRATYNAASGEWLWNFQMRYDGARFVDDTGAVHDVAGLADGAPIAGTVFTRVDADTIRTRGGRAYHFGSDQRLNHAGWAAPAYPRIEYDWDVDELRIAQCPSPGACSDLYAVTLGPAGRPRVVSELRTGRSARFDYDASGRLVAARDALDVERGWPGFRYGYAAGDTLLTSVESSEGERVEYAYQAGRRIWQVRQMGEGDPVHLFEFLWRGDDGFYPAFHTNPLGGRTRYAFDAAARLVEVELEATGERATFTWEGARPASFTTASGVTTAFAYEDDDLALRVEPSGNAVVVDYEPAGIDFVEPRRRARRRVADALGLLEEREYDEEGRVTAVRNGAGEAVSYVYGASALLSVTDAAGITSTFSAFGAHGHWLEVQGANADRRGYDAVGNALVTSAGGQAGGLLWRGFDAGRRVSALRVAASEAGRVTAQGDVAIERRSDGRPLSVTRPGGGAFVFGYDGLGRLVERREWVAQGASGAWRVTRFEVDAAGHRTAVELPNGMREEREYDAYGRLLRHAALRDGVLEAEALFEREAGRLVSVSDSLRGGAEHYDYDGAGRLARVTHPLGETVSFEYDLRSRRTATAFSMPGAGEFLRVEVAYDAADRPVRVSLGSGELLLERVYEVGRLAATRTGGGLERRFQRDPATGRLTASTTLDAAGDPVEQTGIARQVRTDPYRTAIEVDSWTPLAATSEHYALGVGGSLLHPDRLVGKRVFGWSDAAGGERSFSYDELSNQRSNGAGDVHVYDATGSRLLEARPAGGAPIHFAYDAAGFVTSRGGVPLTWTATGRLASFGDLALSWDLSGRPIAWTEGGETRDFSRFGGRVECDPATGAPRVLDLGSVSIEIASGRRTYRHLDFRGNVRFASDEGGRVVAHYQYDPYGVVAAFGPAFDAVRFAGRPELGGLGLLGARIYDPAVGRFLSPDPVFALRNAYAYALGNPVWFWDPDGAEASALPGSVQVAFDQAIATLALAAAGLGTLAFAIPATAPVTGSAALVAGSAATVLSFGQAFDLITAQPLDPGVSELPPGACGQGCAPPPPAADGCSYGPCGALEGPGLLGGGVGLAGGFAGTCAPLGPARTPRSAWALLALVPLQLWLGARLLARARESGRVGD